jgi:hypothetical protein
MWGISGDVGEIYRQQQSDALKDQLLQQEMAQRIKAFEETQAQNRAEAEQRRLTNERLARQEERQTRLDTEAADTRGGQQRAIGNIQNLIPLLQPGTPEFRNEVSQQALRIDPERAVSELLREPKEPTKYRVTTKGPRGEPIASVKTEEELARGDVQEYREPKQPREDQIIPVQTTDAQGNPITVYMRESQALGQNFTRAVPKKPPTGQQSTALAYYKRMDEAIKTMDEVENKVSDKDIFLINNSPLPNLINNPLLSEAGQLYAQALGTYTEARLRKESGAAIAQHEFAQDRQIIGRQVGDTPKTLAQKRQTRQTTARGIARAAGPAYEQEFGEPLEQLTPQTVRPGGDGTQDWLKVPAAQRPVGAEATVPNLGPSTWNGRGWVKK